MILKIKPIKNKDNEWKPQTSVQQYFSQDLLKKIIENEKLTEDMICVQNVSFEAQTQTFSNVVIASEKYNGEFIYLIETENIVKDRKYFFAYITKKSWNTGLKIVFDLTIDPISSNIDLFNEGKFAGEVYIERTNNYQRCVNDTHSDVCVNIINQKEDYKLTETKMIDTIQYFVEKNLPTKIKKTITVDPAFGDHPYFDKKKVIDTLSFDPKGVLIRGIANDGQKIRLLGNKNFQNVTEWAPKSTGEKLPLSIVNILKDYAQNEEFNSDFWHFKTKGDYQDFINALVRQYPFKTENGVITCSPLNKKLLPKIDREILQKETTRWITIPVIFSGLGNDIIDTFVMDMRPILKDFDNIQNHALLHNKYFLSLNRIFKIPLNLIKLHNKFNYTRWIFGIREIIKEGVRFSFFYNAERTDLFYEITLSLQNALLDDTYAKFERDLLISRNAGMSGFGGEVSKFGENALASLMTAGSSFLMGSLASGGNPIVGGITALGTFAGGMINSGLSVPFNTWKENKQIKYERMKIEANPNVARVETSIDMLLKMFEYENFIFSWAYFSSQNYSATVDECSTDCNAGYVILNNKKITLPYNKKYFALIIETPLQCDIDKIITDQERYGNIVNEFKTDDKDYQNPLVLNSLVKDFLFWQGKINPKINPIDNFQLDFLNETLALGVKIIKEKETK